MIVFNIYIAKCMYYKTQLFFNIYKWKQAVAM